MNVTICAPRRLLQRLTQFLQRKTQNMNVRGAFSCYHRLHRTALASLKLRRRVNHRPPNSAEPPSMPRRPARPRIACTLLSSLAVVVLIGCGDEAGPAIFPVTGKVTYRGTPVTTGRVVFNPVGSGLELGESEIQPDGSYRLKSASGAEGAVAGEYRVTVHAFTPGVGEEGVDASYKPPQPLVPAKYASLDATPLIRKVEEKENVIDLPLTD